MLKLKLKKEKEARPTGPAQGINSGSNALFGSAGLGLAVALVPVIAVFAFMLLVREPGIETGQVDRISEAFARQQATHIERYFQ